MHLIAGVADGVGGWKDHGIDPGKFSALYMQNCAEVVRRGSFCPSDPKDILYQAFEMIQHQNASVKSVLLPFNDKYRSFTFMQMPLNCRSKDDRVFGSSTLCILALDKLESKVCTKLSSNFIHSMPKKSINR